VILTEVSQWADGMPAWGHEEDFGMHPPVDRATWEGCAEHDCSLNAARSCVASDEVRPQVRDLAKIFRPQNSNRCSGRGSIVGGNQPHRARHSERDSFALRPAAAHPLTVDVCAVWWK
jgi:hypothetical protein